MESTKLTPTSTSATSLFNSPFRFVLGGNLIAGHANWDAHSTSEPFTSFDTKFVTHGHYSLVFQLVIAPTLHHLDVPPTILYVTITKDDLNI